MHNRDTKSVTHVDNDYGKILLGVFGVESMRGIWLRMVDIWRHMKAHCLGITRKIVKKDQYVAFTVGA